MKSIDVVTAILVDNNKIFVARRGSGEFANLWEFPGGKVEPGETHREALRREILEELEIEIAINKALPVISYDYPDFHVNLHCFMCTLNSGTITLKEHNAGKWITKEGIDSIEWLPANYHLLPALKRQLDS